MQQEQNIFNNSNSVQLANAALYQGDCLSVLPGLSGIFDAVVTDPPYSSGGLHATSRKNSTGDKYLNTSGRKSVFPDFLGDSKDQRSFLHWSILWMGKTFTGIELGDGCFNVAKARLRSAKNCAK